ncbi:caspase domain-containing protein [Schizophyllum commune]
MGFFDIIKRTFANNFRSCVHQASARPASASPADDATLVLRPKISSKWIAVAHVWHTIYSLSHFRKRALLIGIAYGNRKKWTLQGTHGDVDSVQKLLVERYAFRLEDIVIMKDVEGVEPHLWPTELNMRRELINFTLNCGMRDRFFFLYAGHAGQKTERIKGSERDGKDECKMDSPFSFTLADPAIVIIPYDAPNMDGLGCIDDNDLHDYLVKPLKPHCKLVAFLDACHSATLLDLTHDKCLDIGRWRGKAFDILKIPLPEPAARPPKVDRQPEGPQEDACCDAIVPTMDRLVKPWRFCCGLCRPVNRRDEPFVLCISSCKDDESAIETSDVSMTKYLTLITETYEKPSLAELLARVRANLASAYEAEKQKCREQWKEKKAKEGVGKVLRHIPLAYFKLAPNKLPRCLRRHIPCCPPLAKVQVRDLTSVMYEADPSFSRLLCRWRRTCLG